ncbi:MAG: hypothetical protein ACOCW5_00415 [Spirochaetia bacterium]
MKYTKKNRPILLKMLLLAVLIGTFAWELLERIVHMADVPLDLAIGPVGFDLLVISCFLYLNPGTLVGIIGAVILFRRL